MPALRERSEDIVPMAAQFAERAFQSRGKTFAGFCSGGRRARLPAIAGPATCVSCSNVIERTALIWEGGVRSRSRLWRSPAGPPRFASEALGFTEPDLGNPEESYTELKKRWCDTFEREYLHALRRHGGNVSAAARDAKLDRSNFLRLLRKHDVKAQEYRKPGTPGDTDSGVPQAA